MAGSRRLTGVAALCAGVLAALPASALPASAFPGAATATIAWSTYLRAGPGETYTATAELEHDARVQVRSCGPHWCAVFDGDSSGYVDRDALDLPRTLAPTSPAQQDCVVAGQADNRGEIPTRFCSAAVVPR